MKTEYFLQSNELLASRSAGSPGWWLAIMRRGTPFIEQQADGRCLVTFFWRDPLGSELTSHYRRVWVNINCLTDHHNPSGLQSLQRLPGTDVWYWQQSFNAALRASYCFVPCQDEDTPVLQGQDKQADIYAIRSWWGERLAQATPDLLNPYRSWFNARRGFVSGLHLPKALPQAGWAAFDNYEIASARCVPDKTASLQLLHWQSPRLANTRKVWIYSTGAHAPATRPLAILLDGQCWAKQMPIWAPLMQLTEQGALPQAVYVLIDTIDNQQRAKELPCNGEFWQAVQEELLPQVAEQEPFCPKAENTVVAGQSFGGLAALYAGLSFPERFGAVISQSGSFWWPRRDMLYAPDAAQQAGWLLRQVSQHGLGKHGALRIFMEAGRYEHLIHHVNDQMALLLAKMGHQLDYRVVEGGHDVLCWRGGLLDGLQACWQKHITACAGDAAQSAWQD